MNENQNIEDDKNNKKHYKTCRASLLLCRLVSRPLIYMIQCGPPTLRKRGTPFSSLLDVYQKEKEIDRMKYKKLSWCN